jgi:hypothetical protein
MSHETEPTGDDDVYLVKRLRNTAYLLRGKYFLQKNGALDSEVFKVDFENLRLIPATIKDYTNVNYVLETVEVSPSVRVQVSGDDRPPEPHDPDGVAPDFRTVFRRTTP